MHTPSTRLLDRATLLEWLDLDADGALAAPEKARLDAAYAEAVAADPSLAGARRQSAELVGILHGDRVAVREGFRDATMAALPDVAWDAEVAWDSRRRSAWALPLALAASLALVAALLLGASGALDGAQPIVGTGVAVLDFLGTTLLAGAGLLGATWTGVGLGLEELFGRSGVSLVGFGVAVLMVDLLLVALLRRRRPASQGAAADDATAGRDRDEAGR